MSGLQTDIYQKVSFTKIFWQFTAASVNVMLSILKRVLGVDIVFVQLHVICGVGLRSSLIIFKLRSV